VCEIRVLVAPRTRQPYVTLWPARDQLIALASGS
jgi:hypothetical protein